MSRTRFRIRHHLSRVTRSGAWLPEMDGLRGIAILLVVLFHMNTVFFYPPASGDLGAWRFLHHFSERGWIGVQLFFMLSACIIGLPFARAHLQNSPAVALKEFYFRRFTRITPPYLFNLLLLFGLLLLVAPAPQNTLREQWPHLVASATYTHQFFYGTWSSINHVAWSLEIEIQFYLLAPFLCLVFKIQSMILRRALLAVLIIGFSAVRQMDPTAFHQHLPGELCYFFAGFFLLDLSLESWSGGKALAEPSGELSTSSSANLWDWIGLISWSSIFLLLGASPLVTYLLPWLFVLVGASAFRGHWLRWLLSHPAITTLGVMSYTVYLYHITIIAHTAKFLGPVTPGSALIPAQLLLSLTFVLSLSGLLFVLLERPFMGTGFSLALVPKKRLSDRCACRIVEL